MNIKPPRGTHIDKTHPMARDIALYIPFNEQTGSCSDISHSSMGASMTMIPPSASRLSTYYSDYFLLFI